MESVLGRRGEVRWSRRWWLWLWEGTLLWESMRVKRGRKGWGCKRSLVRSMDRRRESRYDGLISLNPTAFI